MTISVFSAESRIEKTLEKKDRLRLIVVDKQNNPLRFIRSVLPKGEKVVLEVYCEEYSVNAQGHGNYVQGKVLKPKPKPKRDGDDPGERVPV